MKLQGKTASIAGPRISSLYRGVGSPLKELSVPARIIN